MIEIVCAAAITAHFLILFFQSSLICGDVIPACLLSANWLHLVLLSIPVVLFVFSGKGKSNLPEDWLKGAAVLGLYAIIVFLTSSASIKDLSYFSQIVLVPLTIFSLTFCAPIMMRRRGYIIFFATSSLLVIFHTLLTITLMIIGTRSVWHHNILNGSGREKYFLGLTLPHTEGLFDNANAIGSFLMYFPGVILSWANLMEPKRRAPLYVAFAIVFLGLFLTFSRGAEITALAALIIPALVLARKAPARGIVTTTLLLVLIGSILSPMLEPPARVEAGERLATGTAEYQKQSRANEAREPLAERTKIWSDLLMETKSEQVITGVGLQNKTWRGLSPHNFYLANFIYFGIGGLALILLLLAIFARRITYIVRSQPALLPVAGTVLSVVLIHGQFEYVLTHPLYFSNSLFWLLIGSLAYSYWSAE